MASNAATARLMARMPAGVDVIEIADDVYVCDPTHKAAILAVMGSHPQVRFLISQDMRADEVVFNNQGDKAWAIRHSSVDPVDELISLQMGVTSEYIAVSFSGEAQRVTAPGVSAVGVTESYATFNGGDYVYEVNGSFTTRTFGPYPVGITKPVDLPSYEAHGIPLAELKRRTTDPSWATSNYGTSTRTYEGNSSGDYPATITPSPRKNMLVIAGPAAIDYGEFFPGFEWIVASYKKVADRLDSVISHAKARDAKIDVSKFESARSDMEKQKASLLLFRGSDAFDPVQMWPQARSAKITAMSSVPVDGTVVTVESKAEGLRQWSSGKWCLTAVGSGSSQAAIVDTMAEIKTAHVVIKLAGISVVHVNDGEGIVSMPLGQALVSLVYAYRRAGTIVTYETSNFDLDGAINAPALAALKTALTVSPVPIEEPTSESLTPSGNIETAGESMCVRLLTPVAITTDEELLVIPAMSPQYFWTKYAREKVVI